MRCAGARAAALLLTLALGSSGCDLVSSLTPFGIGTKEYNAGDNNLNGNWEGSTASGGLVTFQVGGDTVLDLILHHDNSICPPFEALSLEPLVIDGVFTLEMQVAPQGRFHATGTFTSATTCSGTYFFLGLPAGTCPTTGSGSFTAGKLF